MTKPSDIIDADLILLANAKMPFGKYAGQHLLFLPEAYLLWFKEKGFPAGNLGQQMAQILEIKTNGLEYLLQPLIKRTIN